MDKKEFGLLSLLEQMESTKKENEKETIIHQFVKQNEESIYIGMAILSGSSKEDIKLLENLFRSFRKYGVSPTVVMNALTDASKFGNENK